jgi:hypothetical protein
VTDPRPAPLAVKIGVLLLGLGIAAAIWLWDWRWAVMGLLALLVSGVFSASTQPDGTVRDG